MTHMPASNRRSLASLEFVSLSGSLPAQTGFPQVLRAIMLTRPVAIAWCLLVSLAVGLAAKAECQPASASAASQDADPELDRKLERLWAIVLRRPQQGTAFDMLYSAYVDAGRADALLQELQSRLEASPEDGAMQMIAGLIYERRGENRQALAAYAKAGKLLPQQYVPPLHRGRLLARMLRVEEAVVALKRAAECGPPRAQWTEIYQSLARMYLQRGQTDLAREALQVLADRFPDDVGVLEDLAQLLTEEGAVAQAIEAWNRLGAVEGLDRFAKLQCELEVAELLGRQGQHRDAVTRLSRSLQDVDSTSWMARDIHRRVQAMFENAADEQGLVEFYRERSQQAPEDLPAQVFLATLLVKTGAIDEGLEHFRQTVERAPDDREVHEAAIRTLVEVRKWSEAGELLEQLIQKHPRDETLLRQLAQLHLQQATPETRPECEQRAANVWQRILKLDPNSSLMAVHCAEDARQALQTFRLMSIDSDLGRQADDDPVNPQALRTLPPTELDELAEAYYREAIRRSPADGQYREYLGEFLHSLGRADAAVEQWRQLVAGDLGTAANHHRLAEIYAKHGYVRDAITAAQAAIARQPDDFIYRETLVDLLLRTREVDQMDEHLARMSELAQETAVVQKVVNWRVAAAVTGKRVDQVIEQVQREVRQEAGSLEAYWLLSELTNIRWKQTDSVQWLRKAVEQRPDDLYLRAELAKRLRAAGFVREAVEQLSQLAREDVRNRIQHTRQLVELYMRQTQYDQAQDAARKLVEQSPANLDAYRLQASVAFRTRQVDEGLEALRRAVRVAPRDVRMRRELAVALADNRQLPESLDHYWRCFELTEDLATRRSLSITLVEVARRAGRTQELLDRLRQQKRGRDDARVFSLCLIDCLLHLQRFDEAQAELETTLARQPGDQETLGQLIQLAQQRRHWKQAIRHQETLVKLDGSLANLQTLARFYREARQPDQAARIWREIVRLAPDAKEVAVLFDREYFAGRISQAEAIARSGTQRFPENWELSFRWAHVLYTQGSLSQADRQFQRTWTMLVESPIRQTQAVHELIQLAEAEDAYALYSKAIATDRDGNPLVPDVSEGPNAASLPSTPTACRIACMTARFCLGQQADSLEAWMQAEPGSGVSDASEALQPQAVAARLRPIWLQDRVLVAAVARQVNTRWGRTAIEHLMAQSETAALPHLVRLRAEGGHPEQTLPELTASFKWLEANRPELVPLVQAGYLSHLQRFEAEEQLAQLLQQMLANAGTVAELEQAASYVFAEERAELIDDVLLRLAAIVDRQASAAGVAQANYLLQKCLEAGVRTELSEADHLAVFQLLADCLRTGAATSLVAPRGQQPIGGTPREVQAELTRLRGEAGRLRQSEPESHRQLVQLELQRQSLTRQLEQPAVQWELPQETFPRPVPLLPVDRFHTLRRVAAWAQGQSATSTLLSVLRQAEENRSDDDRSALRIAQAMIGWWDGKPQQSLELLETACQELGSSDLQLALAQAYFESDRLRDSLNVIDAIDDSRRRLVRDLRQLRSAVAEQWSVLLKKQLLEGHSHIVRDVAFSPNGQWFASGSYDRTIVLWNARDLTQVKVLTGHEDTVLSLAFTPDSAQLLSASYDGTVRRWDLAGEAPPTLLWSGNRVIRAVAVSPDGEWVAAAGDDKVIRLWRGTEREPVRELKGHLEMVFALDFSRTGETLRLASGAADHLVKVWDVHSGGELQSLKGHLGIVHSVSFSPTDPNRLASAGNDDTLRVWNAGDGAVEGVYRGHTSGVTSVTFTHDGESLITASKDKTLKVWSLDQRKTPLTLFGHANVVAAVDVSPDGKTLVSGSYDRGLIVWDLTKQGESSSRTGNSQ